MLFILQDSLPRESVPCCFELCHKQDPFDQMLCIRHGEHGLHLPPYFKTLELELDGLLAKVLEGLMEEGEEVEKARLAQSRGPRRCFGTPASAQ